MNLKMLSAIAVGALAASQAHAEIVTLDFDSATSFGFLENFYNGGTDSEGAAGPNYGVVFGDYAMALSSVDAPNFTGNPSGTSIMAPIGAASTLNVAAGFFGSASLAYSATEARAVEIWSGLDGTGSLLAVFNLAANSAGCPAEPAFCVWTSTTATFSGLAKSILFGAADGVAGFDDVSLNVVPLPAAAWLLLSALGGFGAVTRRRRAA